MFKVMIDDGELKVAEISGTPAKITADMCALLSFVYNKFLETSESNAGAFRKTILSSESAIFCDIEKREEKMKEIIKKETEEHSKKSEAKDAINALLDAIINAIADDDDESEDKNKEE